MWLGHVFGSTKAGGEETGRLNREAMGRLPEEYAHLFADDPMSDMASWTRSHGLVG